MSLDEKIICSKNKAPFNILNLGYGTIDCIIPLEGL